MAKDPNKASSDELEYDNAGFLVSDDLRTGFITGVTFTDKPVLYSAVDDLAVFEGDIIIGSVEEMERSAALACSSRMVV